MNNKVQRNGCRGIKTPLLLLFNKHIFKRTLSIERTRKTRLCLLENFSPEVNLQLVHTYKIYSHTENVYFNYFINKWRFEIIFVRPIFYGVDNNK